MLEWAKDGHSHSPHPTTTWASRALCPEAMLPVGFHPCLKINLIFLPEEEDGSEADPMQPWEAEVQLCISGLSPAKHPTCSHKPSFSMASEDGEHGPADPRQGPCCSPCTLLLLTPKGCRHRNPCQRCSSVLAQLLPAQTCIPYLQGNNQHSKNKPEKER